MTSGAEARVKRRESLQPPLVLPSSNRRTPSLDARPGASLRRSRRSSRPPTSWATSAGIRWPPIVGGPPIPALYAHELHPQLGRSAASCRRVLERPPAVEQALVAVVQEAYVNDGLYPARVDRLVERLGLHGMSKDQRSAAIGRGLDERSSASTSASPRRRASGAN